MVAIGGDAVVEEQEEEDDDTTYKGGDEGVEELFESGFAKDIAVGAEDGVESDPSGRDNDEAKPEVGVIESRRLKVESGKRLDDEFAEQEKRSP